MPQSDDLCMRHNIAKDADGICPECRAEGGDADSGGDSGISADSASPGSRSVDEQLAILRDHVAARRKLVVFCGFGTAGKTWMLERLFRNLGPHVPVVKRDSRAPGPNVEQRASGKTRNDATLELYFHQVSFPPQANREPFVLVDVVGEQFGDIIRGAPQASMPTIAALMHAHLVVLALPADALLIGKAIDYQCDSERDADLLADDDPRVDRRVLRRLDAEQAEREKVLRQLEEVRHQGWSAEQAANAAAIEQATEDYRERTKCAKLYWDYQDLDAFAENIGQLLSIVSCAKEQETRGELGILQPGFDPQRLIRAWETHSPIPFAAPTYVALTKADAFLPLVGPEPVLRALPPDNPKWPSWRHRDAVAQALADSGWRDAYHDAAHDPNLSMAMANPLLFNTINSWLNISRVDWISADWLADGWSTVQKLKSRTLGVNWLGEWICAKLDETWQHDIDGASRQRVSDLRARMKRLLLEDMA